jgi:hypothetical protein
MRHATFAFPNPRIPTVQATLAMLHMPTVRATSLTPLNATFSILYAGFAVLEPAFAVRKVRVPVRDPFCVLDGRRASGLVAGVRLRRQRAVAAILFRAMTGLLRGRTARRASAAQRQNNHTDNNPRHHSAHDSPPVCHQFEPVWDGEAPSGARF